MRCGDRIERRYADRDLRPQRIPAIKGKVECAGPRDAALSKLRSSDQRFALWNAGLNDSQNLRHAFSNSDSTAA